MPRSLIASLLSLVLVAASGSIASATFTIGVTSTASGFTNLNPTPIAPGANVNTTLLNDGSLELDYNLTSYPGSGFFTLNGTNGLRLIYSGNSSPLSLTITISESAANMYGANSGLFGFASFQAISPTTTDSFSASVAFSPATGGNTINFPTANFNGTTNYSATTEFGSINPTGSITATFTVNLMPESIVKFAGNGTLGSFGDTPTPLPATAFLGVFAVPTLALLRRRMRK